jgi:suppressor of G2 allele of SKP1
VTDFKEQHITITFPLSLGGEFNLELELFGKIVPEGSKGMVHLNRIEIQLEKLEKNVNWPHLKTEFKQSMELTEEYKASYPTSSNKKKDWDKLEKEISVDISKNKEEYGEDPLNSLFKEIFKNSDEDKRRAMIKSFQTSSGTVLSTDWGDVKSKDYEGKDRPSPPKGQ